MREGEKRRKKERKEEREREKKVGKRKKGWGGCQDGRKGAKGYFGKNTLVVGAKCNFKGTNINSHASPFVRV